VRFQYVLITLSDGRELTYYGPEQVLEIDVKHAVVNIKFIEGVPLPEGYSWDEGDMNRKGREERKKVVS
jgi:hypothetical protein